MPEGAALKCFIVQKKGKYDILEHHIVSFSAFLEAVFLF